MWGIVKVAQLHWEDGFRGRRQQLAEVSEMNRDSSGHLLEILGLRVVAFDVL